MTILLAVAEDGAVSDALFKWACGGLCLAVAAMALYIVKQAAQQRADLIAIAPFLAARNTVLEELKPLLVSHNAMLVDIKPLLEDVRDVLATCKARQP